MAVFAGYAKFKQTKFHTHIENSNHREKDLHDKYQQKDLFSILDYWPGLLLNPDTCIYSFGVLF